MIKISIDEGFAFDVLSISQVKLEKCNNSLLKKLNDNFEKLKSEISNEIGEDKLLSILGSEEYQSLKDANQYVFELVDKTKLDNGLAREVDESNYNRYLKKINLQRKFFNNPVTEVKIGYS